MSPCFSGACGMCVGCDGSFAQKLDNSFRVSRVQKDFLSFVNEKELKGIHSEYWQRLYKKNQDNLFVSSEEPGFIPTKVIYAGNDCPTSSSPQKYKLSPTYEGGGCRAYCDERLCQLRQLSFSKFRTHPYPNVPIYTRLGDNKHNICALCVEDQGKYSVNLKVV